MEDGEAGIFSPRALRLHVPFLTELPPQDALQKLVGLPGSSEGHFLKGKLRFGERKWLRGLASRLIPQASAPSHSPGMVSKAGSAPGGHGGSRGEKETPRAGRHRPRLCAQPGCELLCCLGHSSALSGPLPSHLSWPLRDVPSLRSHPTGGERESEDGPQRTHRQTPGPRGH